MYYAGAGTYRIDACFGPTQLDFPIPCWRLNRTFNFIEMSKRLCPCVVGAGLGGYKWAKCLECYDKGGHRSGVTPSLDAIFSVFVVAGSYCSLLLVSGQWDETG